MPRPGAPRQCSTRQRSVSYTRPPCGATPVTAQSHAISLATSLVILGTTADVEEVEVVVAHHERATLHVGDVFLKIDADQTRTDIEVEAMAMAPIPTPEILWRKPPVLALAALRETALGRLGEPSTASSATWAAAGAATRMLHDPPLPPCRVEASTKSHRTSTANASGSSQTASYPPTWSRATAVRPRQLDARTRGTRWRCRRRLRYRR